jgi:hypothetical protein
MEKCTIMNLLNQMRSFAPSPIINPKTSIFLICKPFSRLGMHGWEEIEMNSTLN